MYHLFTVNFAVSESEFFSYVTSNKHTKIRSVPRYRKLRTERGAILDCNLWQSYRRGGSTKAWDWFAQEIRMCVWRSKCERVLHVRVCTGLRMSLVTLGVTPGFALTIPGYQHRPPCAQGSITPFLTILPARHTVADYSYSPRTRVVRGSPYVLSRVAEVMAGYVAAELFLALLRLEPRAVYVRRKRYQFRELRSKCQESVTKSLVASRMGR